MVLAISFPFFEVFTFSCNNSFKANLKCDETFQKGIVMFHLKERDEPFYSYDILTMAIHIWHVMLSAVLHCMKQCHFRGCNFKSDLFVLSHL